SAGRARRSTGGSPLSAATPVPAPAPLAPAALEGVLRQLTANPQLRGLIEEGLKALADWVGRHTLAPAAAADQEAALLEARVAAAQGDVGALLALWREREREQAVWARCPAAYRTLAERLRSQGSPLVALEVVTEGLEHHWPGDLRLRQLQGLALADTRATERA